VRCAIELCLGLCQVPRGRRGAAAAAAAPGSAREAPGNSPAAALFPASAAGYLAKVRGVRAVLGPRFYRAMKRAVRRHLLRKCLARCVVLSCSSRLASRAFRLFALLRVRQKRVIRVTCLADVHLVIR
jgi:hypothetical protein